MWRWVGTVRWSIRILEPPAAFNTCFAERVLALLHRQELITDEDVSQVLSQGHAGFGVWVGDAFEDKDRTLFVARYIERCSLSLEKLSIDEDIVTYTTNDGRAHEFDALEFLALLSTGIPKPGESVIRYYGRYSCRGRGERAKEAAVMAKTGEALENPEPTQKPSATWAQCMKRILEIDPLECPKCGSQMRIIAFVHDCREIEKIMQSLGIPKSQAPPPIPKASSPGAEHNVPEVDYH
jgi:hypothetical protein